MATTLIIPGLGGSDSGHWQQWWLRNDPNAVLVEQADWRKPCPVRWTISPEDLSAWCRQASSRPNRSLGQKDLASRQSLYNLDLDSRDSSRDQWLEESSDWRGA